KKDKLWGMPVPITAPTEKGNQLVDHLSRYKNYLEEDYSRIYENDENYRQHIIWSVLVGEGENVRKYLSKLTPDETGDSIYPTMVNYYYGPDRKSTRLNSSHVSISYAVFCLKKKTKNNNN